MATLLTYVLGHCTHHLRVSLATVSDHHVLNVAYVTSVTLMSKYNCIMTLKSTSRGCRMSKAPASCSGRSGHSNIACSSLESAYSTRGRVKPMTLKLILAASYPWHPALL